MNIVIKSMALVHSVCPLCLMGRRWPESAIAKIRTGVAKGCPFCLADAKIRSESLKTQEKGGEEDAVG